MMVWRNSVTCLPSEREDLRKAIYAYALTLKKGSVERKKYVKYYQAFKNADERQAEDVKGN
jgi:hypothetical protein